MNAKQFALAIAGVSAALLGGAWAFQLWGGLFPCELCLAQRWPWYVALAVAILALAIGKPSLARHLPLAAAAIMIVSTGLAFYHVGVENHFLPGPSACTATQSGRGLTTEELMRQIMAAPVIRCDTIQWSLFGVSLAGWNLFASLGMLGLSVWQWRKTA
jgi:disulfide bond formation protein DsbB